MRERKRERVRERERERQREKEKQRDRDREGQTDFLLLTNEDPDEAAVVPQDEEGEDHGEGR